MGSMLTLYHGSNVIVKNPQVLTNGFIKILATALLYQFRKTSAALGVD